MKKVLVLLLSFIVVAGLARFALKNAGGAG